MSKVHKRGSATPEMNMTPLIDVTFQLIIFFMLVNNIIAEENVEMIVPTLENPKTRQLGEVERVTVNMAPFPYVRKDRTSGEPLKFPGDVAYVKIGMDQFGAEDIPNITNALKESKSRNPNIEVLLRGDAALSYRSVQPIMAAINAAGITTVNLVAAMPPEGGEPAEGGAAADTTAE